jgi:hypothetical protein
MNTQTPANKIRVLQSPVNMAGQATLISNYLREIGIKCDLLVFNRHPFGYKHDISLDLKEKKTKVAKAAIVIANFIKCALNYDVFHFHFGLTLLPNLVDLPVLKLMRKKVVMHYWGDDIRQNDISSGYTCLSLQELKEIYPNKNDEEMRKKIRTIDRYADITIVGDYALLPYSPKSKVIKQAIDLSLWNFVGQGPRRDSVKIVHAPSNKIVKGTKYILPVIDRLREEGFNIDFVLLENMSNQQVREHCIDANIIVDQLLLESYGVFAIECMALGKPVLCRIDEHFIKYYPDLPVVNTDPDTLYDNLKMLIKDHDLRIDIGKRSRIFVEETHDARKIAEQLAQLYRSL